MQTQVRTCDMPAPQCNGDPCSGNAFKNILCDKGDCPCVYNDVIYQVGEEITNHDDRDCTVW